MNRRPINLGEIEGLLELAAARIDRTTMTIAKYAECEKMALEYINRVTGAVMSMIDYSDPLTPEVREKFATFNRRHDGFLNILNFFESSHEPAMKMRAEEVLLKEILCGIQPTQDFYLNHLQETELAFVLEKRTLSDKPFNALRSKILNEQEDCKTYLKLCENYCRILAHQVLSERYPVVMRANYLKELSSEWKYLGGSYHWLQKLENSLDQKQENLSEREYFAHGIVFLEDLLDDIFYASQAYIQAPRCLDENFCSGLPLFLRQYQAEFIVKHADHAYQALSQMCAEELAPDWAYDAWRKIDRLRERIEFLYHPLQLNQEAFPAFVC